MSRFCRGCSRELSKDRDGKAQYCGYCRDTMKNLLRTKDKPKDSK